MDEFVWSIYEIIERKFKPALGSPNPKRKETVSSTHAQHDNHHTDAHQTLTQTHTLNAQHYQSFSKESHFIIQHASN
jgi:hypothetical protein